MRKCFVYFCVLRLKTFHSIWSEVISRRRVTGVSQYRLLFSQILKLNTEMFKKCYILLTKVKFRKNCEMNVKGKQYQLCEAALGHEPLVERQLSFSNTKQLTPWLGTGFGNHNVHWPVVHFHPEWPPGATASCPKTRQHGEDWTDTLGLQDKS